MSRLFVEVYTSRVSSRDKILIDTNDIKKIQFVHPNSDVLKNFKEDGIEINSFINGDYYCPKTSLEILALIDGEVA